MIHTNSEGCDWVATAMRLYDTEPRNYTELHVTQLNSTLYLCLLRTKCNQPRTCLDVPVYEAPAMYCIQAREERLQDHGDDNVLPHAATVLAHVAVDIPLRHSEWVEQANI